jgi:ribonuclease HI
MPQRAGPLVAVYADESCLGNGREGANRGAAGGLIEIMRGGAVQRFEYWVSEAATTNNRMALQSAITALNLLAAKGTRCRVVFTSDSKYLIDGNTSWIYGWIRRGWKREAGPIENESLWRELAEARGAHDVEWRWVKGHAGQPQNEYANFLATRAAAEQTQSSGIRAAHFDAWVAVEQARRRSAKAPFAFPDAATFAPSAPLPRSTASAIAR